MTTTPVRPKSASSLSSSHSIGSRSFVVLQPPAPLMFDFFLISRGAALQHDLERSLELMKILLEALLRSPAPPSSSSWLPEPPLSTSSTSSSMSYFSALSSSSSAAAVTAAYSTTPTQGNSRHISPMRRKALETLRNAPSLALTTSSSTSSSALLSPTASLLAMMNWTRYGARVEMNFSSIHSPCSLFPSPDCAHEC